MKINWRITLWIIALTLGTSIVMAVYMRQGDVAKYLALALVGIGKELAALESKDSSPTESKK